MRLATIETEAGKMSIHLAYDNGKRLLTARKWRTREKLSDQPEGGYPRGKRGIVDAIGDLQSWYQARTWGLNLLVDWRDYTPWPEGTK